MLHLHAITEPHPTAAAAGIGGTGIVSIPCGRLGLVVSEHRTPAPDLTEETLWHHEAVLEQLMAEGPVLPIRFGVRFADAAALCDELRPRMASLAEALEYVRGKVELGVRVLEDNEKPPAPRRSTRSGEGARYLLERLDRRNRAAAVAERLRRNVGDLAVGEQARLLPGKGTLVASAFLVERPRVAGFRRRVEVLERSLDHAALFCTGPWPPYHFVDRPI